MRNWSAAIRKVADYTLRHRIPDAGGVALLEALAPCAQPVVEEALSSGVWDFRPLTAHFVHENRMQTLSSTLDRLVVQLVLGDAGFRAQTDWINAGCDDQLMPIPPAFRFRPPQAGYMYSNWVSDYRNWSDAARLFELRGYSWSVCCDIRNCFYTIHRPTVLELVEPYLDSAAHRELLRSRLDYRIDDHGRVSRLLGGLPVEEPSSHLLANVFLTQLDRWAVEELCVPHVRFVDDVRFFCRSEAEGRRVLRAVAEVLQTRFGLRLNDDKSSVARIDGSADAVAAASLLCEMKDRIEDPLEERQGIGCWRAVAVDEALDAWNEIARALGDGAAEASAVNRHLDLLAGLRPAAGWTEAFGSLMKSVLEKALKVSASGTNARVRRRLVGIAMQHICSADPAGAVGRLRVYLQDREPEVCGMAFSALVRIGTPEAQLVAEESILAQESAGNRDVALLRLGIFVRRFGSSARLRRAFGRDGDWRWRLLAGAPPGSRDEGEDLVLGLSDESPLVRRNAALQLAERGGLTGYPQVRRAWLNALAAEEDRDARLAMLLPAGAGAALSDDSAARVGSSRWTRLEAALWAGLREQRIAIGRPFAGSGEPSAWCASRGVSEDGVALYGRPG